MPLYESQHIKLYNSLSGEKETLEPITQGRIGMYVCGPTVYNHVHLGNCRTLISFDVIYRYLNHLGYKVRYVRNITDVGHLENDSDDGEDKITKRARLEQIEPMEISEKYTYYFHEVLRQFNLLPPSIEPRATGHIPEQIEFVQKILDSGFAYEKNGSVYFDVIKYDKAGKQYGILSNRNIEELQHLSRDLAASSDKKNPQDFALWKKAESKHIMKWNSPWSKGFPGWHLECCAMSQKYLGDTFDIHGGGIDLKFPHHECEIAQSQAGNNANPVKYWLHANMLKINGKRMEKSTNNFILPHEIFEGSNPQLSKSYKPAVTRFFMLQTQYRGVLDFTESGIEAAQKGYSRLMEAYRKLKDLKTSKQDTWDIKIWIQTCYDAMNDDFNTPVLIANLFEGVKWISSISLGKDTITEDSLKLVSKTFKSFIFDVLGLEDQIEVPYPQTKNNKLDEVIQLLLAIRKGAKHEKNFQLADEIRLELDKMGIEIQDLQDNETTYKIK